MSADMSAEGSGRREVVSGAPWEERVGYCRAVRSGPLVSVSGTAAVEADGSVTEGGAGAQAERILRIIEAALGELDALMEEVVRTRIYVVEMEDWPAVAEAYRGRFGASRPAATLVQVSGLVEPAMLVEIEVDAWSPEGGNDGGRRVPGVGAGGDEIPAASAGMTEE